MLVWIYIYIYIIYAPRQSFRNISLPILWHSPSICPYLVYSRPFSPHILMHILYLPIYFDTFPLSAHILINVPIYAFLFSVQTLTHSLAAHILIHSLAAHILIHSLAAHILIHSLSAHILIDSLSAHILIHSLAVHILIHSLAPHTLIHYLSAHTLIHALPVSDHISVHGMTSRWCRTNALLLSGQWRRARSDRLQ